MSNEVVPATGTDVVPATGREVAPTTGNDVALLREEAPAKEGPRLEAPKEKPSGGRREVDPSRMHPGDARRLVNRVRRYRFYLFMRTAMYETQYKGDYNGVHASELLPIGQQDLIAYLRKLEERHPSRWIHVMLREDSRFLAIS